MDAECKPTVLLDIWRTCSKIRAATSRSGVDLWSHYLPLDRDGSNLISEVEFVSVLEGLKDCVGLTEEEIVSLTNHFKAPDGRILYKQFCQVVQDNGPNTKTQGTVHVGLEWEEAFHVNSLTMVEERRVMLLLTKIAAMAKVRGLVLLPHFQDYEEVAKNGGTITISHFARILHFLKISVSPDEFQLLVKKFVKDGCSLNCKALVSALETVSKYLENCGIINMAEESLPSLQIRAVTPTRALSRLPRPRSSSEPRSEPAVRVENVFYTVVNNPRLSHSQRHVLERIRRNINSNSVRVGQIFRELDPTNCGRLPEGAFRRCLGTLLAGDSGTQQCALTGDETDRLVDAYRDPLGPSRCIWKNFAEDVGVSTKVDVPALKGKRETSTYLNLVDRSKNIGTHGGDDVTVLFTKDGPPRLLGQCGGYPPQLGTKDLAVSCEDILRLIKDRLLPEFSELDRSKNGHLDKKQFQQVLFNNRILLNGEQIRSLEQRYMDELGFNYLRFIQDAGPTSESPLHVGGVQIGTSESSKPSRPCDKEISPVLEKIKKRLVCYPARMSQFMSQFDLHNQLVISRKNFVRSLDDKLKLTAAEKEIIMEAFASPTRPHCVEYKRFCDCVERPSQTLQGLAPLQSPFQHDTHNEGEHNFLNFHQRQLVSVALEKLAAQPTDALLDAFREVDNCNCGTVNQKDFLKVLTKLCLHTVLSPSQLEALKKCFCKLSETSEDIDYKGLVDALAKQKNRGNSSKA